MAVTTDFLEGVLARCPPDHAVLIAYGRTIFELIQIEYGALMIRPADGFKLSLEPAFETEDLEVTGFWYLSEQT
jgi:hypothetical protein